MARSLSVISVLLLVVVQAFAAKVPSYIKICGRRDPDLNNCVIDSVEKLKPKLRSGIEELSVPRMEPLSVGEVPLSTLDDFTAIATDVKISGISGFKITHLKLDFDKEKIDIAVIIPNVVMEADYKVRAKILFVVQDEGPISTVSRDVYATISLKFKKHPYRGKTHLYFTNIVMKLALKDFEAKFKSSRDGPFAEAINSVLVNSKQDILDSMTPNLEKAISTKIIETANQLCKNFTFDDLFPDRV